ncbi:LuxR C-terminal-related transcriptional regulator [Serratia fonticola]|uniref:LuxR C-terminal-related transcriptional regulator n=1 Tax=Serratia fonticola TaxID=47917 RepID=UPI0021AE263B|nr:LuxR C-terminal-related transcriptional regulator [Serratia fonticola]
MSASNSLTHYHSINHGARLIVFFSDFPTETGLNYLIKNTPLHSSYLESKSYSTDIHSIEIIKSNKENRPHSMRAYDLINHLLVLKRRGIYSQIIFLTENHNIEILKLLLSFNVFYLLSKNECMDFIHKSVLNPMNIIGPGASPKVIEKIGGDEVLKSLSQREWFVLNSLSRNLSPSTISKLLGISIKTISAHKINAMNKLRLTSPQLLKLLMRLAEVKSISTITIKEMSN